MPSRTLTADGVQWSVVPSGAITQYDRDEFALIFTPVHGNVADARVTRYSPETARSREQSFAELTDAQLQELLQQSQPSTTSPELRYGYAR